MQASTPSQPSAAPQAPPAPVAITTVGPDGKPQTITIPRTDREVEALLARRSQLSDQLRSASGRRNELSEQIRIAPDGVSRTGLEERIKVLDQRILQLETDLAAVGSQLASAPGDMVSFAETRRANSDEGWEEGFAFGGGFAFLGALIVYFFMRRRWRRRGAARRDQLPAESASRLERLEHGMEAIAVEIERISEGQRFVTKLLAEHEPLAASNRIGQSGSSNR